MRLLDMTLEVITPQSKHWRSLAKERLDQLCMPHWALGKLMDLGMDLSGITQSLQPDINQKVIVVMAGDHGVVEEGVSKFPQEVTGQMLANFANGKAGINVLARQAGADVKVVDMGVAAEVDVSVANQLISKSQGKGTFNIAKGPAMTREMAIGALEAGIEVSNELSEYQVVGTGDMGIGNTTPSAAIICALTDAPPTQIVGRGTGLNDEQLSHKIKIVEESLVTNRPNLSDGIDVLAKVGGFEIGGLAGLILGAAANRKVVVVDGFISTAAALIAQAISPVCAQFMVAAHRSEERGHTAALSLLNKTPLLNLDFRLGEGTGGAVAMMLLDSAKHVLTDIATFDEALVSKAVS